MNSKKIKINKGFSLVEIVIGASIISLFLFASVPLFQSYLKAGSQNTKIIQASFLLEEGIEAVKMLRDNGWQNNITTLDTGTEYHLYFNGVSWETSNSSNQIDGVFRRTVTLSDVYRDNSDNIAESGTIDSDTQKVDVSVSWLGNRGTTTKTLSTYITNIFDN